MTDLGDAVIERIARAARRPVEMDESARERLIAAIAVEPPPRRELRPWRRFVAPRPMLMSPIAGLALAAGLVGVGVVTGLLLQDRSAGVPLTASEPSIPAAQSVPTRPAVSSSESRMTFVLVAPHARDVAVVGDFNDWDATVTPMQRTPTGGTWSVTVPLTPGRHIYSFVVDGSTWVPDPAAPLAPDDGFGGSNSVVLVGGNRS
jgi:hypothetical protein